MEVVKLGNLALAFLLELSALAAYAYWGFTVGTTLPMKLLLGLGAPALAIILWAIWGAPKSTHHLTGISYNLLALLVFGPAAFALAFAGQPALAIVLLALQIINRLLRFVWNQ